MEETNDEKKLMLKILVDVKAKKVVFAEADKKFVDFIFSLMSLPLSSVTKTLLLNDKSMPGSLGDLYNSIECLDTQCYKPDINSSSVLTTKPSVAVTLLSLHESPAPKSRIFKCYKASHYKVSDIQRPNCCNQEMYELACTNVEQKKTAEGYVNGGAVYMVTDNLEVKPMSIVLARSYVKEVGDLEERQVEVGLQEGLDILKASLETKSVLTTVFLKNI